MTNRLNPVATAKPLGLVGIFIAALCQELRTLLRKRSELINPWLFFFIVLLSFPFSLGPDPQLLATIAPGIIWVTALLATLLGLDNLFRSDYEAGNLEQLLLSCQPLSFWVLIKVISHWLLSGLVLSLLAPVLALMFYLPVSTLWPLFITLLLGTPSLTLVGALGAALTLCVKRGGLLLVLLILPFYIPVLIFGTAALQAAVNGEPFSAELAYLGAILCLALVLSPLASGAALRISLVD
jgi:heme exporter protein B